MSSLKNIDKRYVYLVIIAITLYPLIYPMGLPIPINDDTRAFYEGIEAIPVDAVVIMDWNTRFGRPTRMILMEDVFRRLMVRGIKVIHVSFDKALEGGEVCNLVINKVDPEANYGYEYGVDYVNLGSVGGSVSAMAGFVADVWGIFPVDQRGTPVDDMPIMQSLKVGTDIDAIVFAGTSHMGWIGQLTQTHPVPLLGCVDAGEATEVIPYVQSGQIVGILNDMRGGAEYEVLTGVPGEAIKTTDPLSTIQLGQAALLIVTNIIYFMSKGKEGGD
jgi:hypothetical protein